MANDVLEARPRPHDVMNICPACRSLFETPLAQCATCGYEPQIKNGYLSYAPEITEDGVGYQIKYFDSLYRLEQDHFWFEARNRFLSWVLRRFLPAQGAFLEIGCGTGFLLRAIRQALPDWTLYGSDVFVEAIPYAQSRVPDANFMQLDARSLPFQSCFESIGIFDVLEHIEDDRVVIRQMFQAVKPGGTVVITAPQHPFLWSMVDEHSGHFRRYTRAEMIGKVEQAGFEVLYVTAFVSLLLPLFWLSRWRFPQDDARFDLFQALQVGRLNGLFKQVMRVERWLIRAGIRMPLGSSLLVVARRPA